ncbi:HNH endonuclease family protein, partial [Staphylococcus coagulans]
LEHILPQNPKDGSSWLTIFADDLNEYIYKLGNLTLILGKRNSDLGNKEFNEKRIQLKESKISQNTAISKNNSWTRLEIDNRTEELAKMILELWPILNA